MLNLKSSRSEGFSLVELLLVLAIIGIISGIAIPTFLGQRRRARVIGDAETNAQSLAMQMEAKKAETGLYGSTNATCTWTKGVPSNSTLVPGVSFKNATQMNMAIKVTSGGLKYTITVTDPSVGSATVLTRTQDGATVLNQNYSK